MKIGVVGGGYVGLVTAAGLAEIGHTVVCYDSDENKRTLLKGGSCPIYEPGLSELIQTCVSQHGLSFVDSVIEVVDGCQIVFIAVGTPPSEDGSADLSFVLDAAKQIASVVSDDVVVVVKSTVPVGTCQRISELIDQTLAKRSVSIRCEVVSNPEFLKEGDALRDFRRPDRIVIGSDSPSAIHLMRQLFAPLTRNHERMVVVSRESSELGKYAANAMLATRISFMNEISRISEQTDADIEQIRIVVGSDSRIGPDFLYAGPGFGGSCFPKDLQALRYLGKSLEVPTSLIDAVVEVNRSQRAIVINKIRTALGELSGKTVAVWGLTFKPGTDDIRDSPSLSIINTLLNEGASVQVFDPMVKDLGVELGQRVAVIGDRYEVLGNADLLVLATEWKIFRKPDFEVVARMMRGRHIFDTRNIWNPNEVESAGLSYIGIGR